MAPYIQKSVKCAALSLMEVMICILIIGSIMVPMTSTLTLGVQWGSDMRHQVVAQNLAQGMIEEAIANTTSYGGSARQTWGTSATPSIMLNGQKYWTSLKVDTSFTLNSLMGLNWGGSVSLNEASMTTRLTAVVENASDGYTLELTSLANLPKIPEDPFYMTLTEGKSIYLLDTVDWELTVKFDLSNKRSLSSDFSTLTTDAPNTPTPGNEHEHRPLWGVVHPSGRWYYFVDEHYIVGMIADSDSDDYGREFFHLKPNAVNEIAWENNTGIRKGLMGGLEVSPCGNFLYHHNLKAVNATNGRYDVYQIASDTGSFSLLQSFGQNILATKTSGKPVIAPDGKAYWYPREAGGLPRCLVWFDPLQKAFFKSGQLFGSAEPYSEKFISGLQISHDNRFIIALTRDTSDNVFIKVFELSTLKPGGSPKIVENFEMTAATFFNGNGADNSLAFTKHPYENSFVCSGEHTGYNKIGKFEIDSNGKVTQYALYPLIENRPNIYAMEFSKDGSLLLALQQFNEEPDTLQMDRLYIFDWAKFKSSSGGNLPIYQSFELKRNFYFRNLTRRHFDTAYITDQGAKRVHAFDLGRYKFYAHSDSLPVNIESALATDVVNAKPFKTIIHPGLGKMFVALQGSYFNDGANISSTCQDIATFNISSATALFEPVDIHPLNTLQGFAFNATGTRLYTVTNDESGLAEDPHATDTLIISLVAGLGDTASQSVTLASFPLEVPFFNTTPYQMEFLRNGSESLVITCASSTYASDTGVFLFNEGSIEDNPATATHEIEMVKGSNGGSWNGYTMIKYHNKLFAFNHINTTTTDACRMTTIYPDGTATTTPSLLNYGYISAATVHHDKLYFAGNDNNDKPFVLHFSTASQTGSFDVTSNGGYLVEDYLPADWPSTTPVHLTLESFRDKLYLHEFDAYGGARISSDSHPFDTTTDLLRLNSTPKDQWLHPGVTNVRNTWGGVMQNKLWLCSQHEILQWDGLAGIDRVYKNTGVNHWFNSGVEFRGKILFAMSNNGSGVSAVVPINIPESKTGSLTFDLGDDIYTGYIATLGSNREAWRMSVWEDKLYVSVDNTSTNHGEIWCYDPELLSQNERWQLACILPLSSGGAFGDQPRQSDMIPCGDWLYILSNEGKIFRIRPKVRYKQSWRDIAGSTETHLDKIWDMKTFRGELVVAGKPQVAGNDCPIKVLRNGAFVEIDDIGGSNFNASFTQLMGKTVSSMEIYNGELWVGFTLVDSFKGSGDKDSYLMHSKDLVTWNRVDHFNDWSIDTHLPVPVFDHKMVSYQGNIYIIGGKVATSSVTFSRQIQIYNPSEKSWTVTPIDGSGKLDYVDSAFTHNGVVAFYSRGATPTDPSKYYYFYPENPGTILASDVYDTMPGYKNFNTHILGGKIFNMYGENTAGISPQPASESFWILDPTVESSWNWHNQASAPVALKGEAQAVWDGKVYTFGGNTNAVDNPTATNIYYDFTEPYGGYTTQYGIGVNKSKGIAVDKNYIFNENFNSSTIDPEKWVVKFANSGDLTHVGGKLHLDSASTDWDGKTLFSRTQFKRVAGLTFEFELESIGADGDVFVGFFKDSVADDFTVVYEQIEAGIHLSTSDNAIFTFFGGSWTTSSTKLDTGLTNDSDFTYRFKIILNATGGADFFISMNHGKTWTALNAQNQNPNNMNLRIGISYCGNGAPVEVDNFEVYYGDKALPHIYMNDGDQSLKLFKPGGFNQVLIGSLPNPGLGDKTDHYTGLSYSAKENLVYGTEITAVGTDGKVATFDAGGKKDFLCKGIFTTYGGRNTSSARHDHINMFDQDTRQWATAPYYDEPNPWSGHEYSSGAYANNTFWWFGGYSTPSSDRDDFCKFIDTPPDNQHIFDHTYYEGGAAAIIENRSSGIYYFYHYGGGPGTDNETNVLLRAALGTDGNSNPASFTTLASAPYSRSCAGMVAINGKLYINGGTIQDYYLNWADGLANCFRYTPLTNSWAVMSSCGYGNLEFGAAAYMGRFFTFGGYDDTSASIHNKVSYLDTEKTSSGIWFPIADATWSNRCTLKAETLNGKIIVHGGRDSVTRYSNTYEFDPQTETWTTSLDTNPDVSYGFAAGGWHKKREFNDPFGIARSRGPDPYTYVSAWQDNKVYRIGRVASANKSESNRIEISVCLGDGTSGLDTTYEIGTSFNFGKPCGLDTDWSGKNLYVASDNESAIVHVDEFGKAQRFFGDGNTTESGDGVLAVNARIGVPVDLAVDGFNNVFTCTTHGTSNVRMIDKWGIAHTYAGQLNNEADWPDGNYIASATDFHHLMGVDTDIYNNVYVIEKRNYKIIKIPALWHRNGQSLPVPVKYSQANTTQGKIFITGGRTDNAARTTYSGLIATSAVQIFNPKTDAYESPADFPSLKQARAHHSSCMLNDSIYVAGGLDSGGQKIISSIEIYSPWKNRDFTNWAASAPMVLPEPTESHSLVVANDALYMIEGDGGTTNNRARLRRFNSKTSKWSRPWTPPWSMDMDSTRAATLNGIIYFFGSDNNSFKQTVFSFSPFSGKWQKYDDVPATNMLQATEPVEFSGKFYLFGSSDNTNNGNKKVYEFDPNKDTGAQWQIIATNLNVGASWGNRVFHSGYNIPINFGNHIVLTDGLGWGFTKVEINRFTPTTINTAEWKTLPTVTSSKNHLAIPFAGKIYYANSGDNGFWEYNPVVDTWNKINSTYLPAGYHLASSILWGSYFITSGGNNGTTQDTVHFTELKPESDNSDRMITKLKVCDGKLLVAESYANKNHRVHVFDGINWNHDDKNQFPMIFNKYKRYTALGNLLTIRETGTINNLELYYDHLFLTGGVDKFNQFTDTAFSTLYEYSNLTGYLPTELSQTNTDMEDGADLFTKWGGKLFIGEKRKNITPETMQIYCFDIKTRTKDIYTQSNSAYAWDLSESDERGFSTATTYKDNFMLFNEKGLVFTSNLSPTLNISPASNDVGSFSLTKRAKLVTSAVTYKGLLLGGADDGTISGTTNSYFSDIQGGELSSGQLGEFLFSAFTPIASETSHLFALLSTNTGGWLSRKMLSYQANEGYQMDADSINPDWKIDSFLDGNTNGIPIQLISGPDGKFVYVLDRSDSSHCHIYAIKITGDFSGIQPEYSSIAALNSDYQTISYNSSGAGTGLKRYCEKALSIALSPDGTRLIVGVNDAGIQPVGKEILGKGIVIFDITPLYSGQPAQFIATATAIYNGNPVEPSFISTPKLR